jgi:hypothetical protein
VTILKQERITLTSITLCETYSWILLRRHHGQSFRRSLKCVRNRREAKEILNRVPGIGADFMLGVQYWLRVKIG